MQVFIYSNLVKCNRVTVILSFVITDKILYLNLLYILVGCNLSFTRSLNVSYLKWMNNLQQIEHHQNIFYLFFIFNLTCCKFVSMKKIHSLTLFKIITISRRSILIRVPIWGDQDVPLRMEIGQEISLQAPKCELSPSFGYPSYSIESPRRSPDHRPHIKKKYF